MAEADLIKLYSKRILALAADIPHAERLVEPMATASKRSPLCGSTVVADVTVEDCRLADLGMDVKACALGQASAAVLGSAAIGKSRGEIAEARERLSAMLKEGGAPPEGDFAALEVLSPARDYKNRHASILLAWDAVIDAMNQIAAQRGCGAAGGK